MAVLPGGSHNAVASGRFPFEHTDLLRVARLPIPLTNPHNRASLEPIAEIILANSGVYPEAITAWTQRNQSHSDREC